MHSENQHLEFKQLWKDDHLKTICAFATSFFVLTCLLTPIFGLKAPVVAHAVNYAIYWALMIVLIVGIFLASNNTSIDKMAE